MRRKSGELVVFEAVTLIIGASAGNGNAAAFNPIDPVEFASILAGALVFLFFAVTISYSSYKRRKETEARVAEWERSEQEHRRKLKEEMSMAEARNRSRRNKR